MWQWADGSVEEYVHLSVAVVGVLDAVRGHVRGLQAGPDHAAGRQTHVHAHLMAGPEIN